MKNELLLFIAAAFISASAFAQRMPKLEIGYGEVYTVAAENTLYVDTLVLRDKASIKFAPAKQGVLEAKVAYVGKDCTVTAKGADGAAGSRKSAGESGEDGGSLSVVMHFAQLGSLTLDTRGGKGGRGADGKDGRRGKRDSHEKVVSRGANG
ncbi:hypothetical protein [Pontibacter mangrovi]|uniref:Uncharacterized protein n=1 Tax=Pontibacter mangrovi TaxID=2589816 RepID=A0A501WDG4_9BACT|nr:hypothetical protein [Pontibacter mangrovi]TPE43546.1 hypothetical protein FJM65_12375 [Pontibacter mangrovi]